MRVLRCLALQRADPIILAGDFNCPKLELADGTIVGWGRPEQRGVEENLFKRFSDAFRQLGRVLIKAFEPLRRCPLCPQERTCSASASMSAKCH